MNNAAPQQNSLEYLKIKMRDDQKKLRIALSQKEQRDASRKIVEKFIANIPLETNDKIAGYWPVNGEVNITLALEILQDKGHCTALPVIVGKDKPLIFKQYKTGDNLYCSKYFDTQEPHETALTITPSIIIVPLIAIDRSGYRLGFGGGFYDRTITTLHKKNDLMTIGVGYDFQLINAVPHNEHDQKLDVFISEKRVIIYE